MDLAFTRYAVGRLLHQSGAQLDHPIALYVLGNNGLRVAQSFTRSAAALDAALRAIPTELSWRLGKNDADSTLERIKRSTLALAQIASASFGVAGHKSLIWISPGFPLFSPLNLSQTGRKQLADNLRHLSNQLLEARMTIDSVDPRGVIAPPIVDLNVLRRQQSPAGNDILGASITAVAASGHTSFNDIAIQTLAQQTGGHVYYGRNDIDAALADSIREGGTYYTLSYAPAQHDFHGEFRKVQVTLVHPSTPLSVLAVHTRDGYYALADDAAALAQRRYSELGTSLFASPLDYRAIPILMTEARRPAAHQPPTDAVGVHLLIPSSALTWEPDAQGNFACALMLASADRADGGTWRRSLVKLYRITLPQGERPSPEHQASVDFAMPYRHSDQLRFVVQDQATGRIGSSEYTLQKPGTTPP